jgi:hypothetical protein
MQEQWTFSTLVGKILPVLFNCLTSLIYSQAKKLLIIKNLSISSKYSDELLECDSCGFYVHEGCYGISDTDSKSSNISNASTEPWFCNSCLLTDPLSTTFTLTRRVIHQCELCPNTECGLLKETDNGRFAHIVCALYVPGVTFQDTDKLWPVVLDEIPIQRWGEQVCSLCEDGQYSRTGVCIQCDAGLCKTYFHVTCAQSQGLLVDPAKQVWNENLNLKI